MIRNGIGKKVIALALSFAMLSQITSFAASKNDDGKKIKEKPKYNTTELIIKYKDKADKEKIKHNVRLKTLNISMSSKDELKNKKNMEVVDVNSIDNMDKSINAFEQQEGVEFASPNYKVKTYSYSDEEMFSQQWALKNSGQTIGGQAGVEGIDVNAIPAWEMANGKGVLIGVLDTGIKLDNSELAANIYINTKEIAGNGIDDDNNGFIDDVNGWNFADDNNVLYNSATEDKHGTNVAGVIAAEANGSGIVGIAPEAKILPLKFIKGSDGNTADAIEAIEYAKSMGVKIMNCSWGCSEFNMALKSEMDSSGLLFICAAGNEGSGGVSYPASFGISNIISVGAIDNKGNIEEYSSSGKTQDIYAPGTDILATSCNGSFENITGTSFSAAYVSGIAALIQQSVPKITCDELQLSITKGLTEKTKKKVKVADAYLAIKNALPLNFIKDTDSRLSRAMKYADKIITPDLAEVLNNFTKWDALDNSSQNVIKRFFDVTNNEMDECLNQGLDIIDSIIVVLAAERVNIDVQISLSLLETYGNGKEFDNQIEGLKSIYDRIKLSNKEKTSVINLMKNGHNSVYIAKSIIMARTINRPLTDVISLIDNSYDIYETEYSDAEKESLKSLVYTYNLDMAYIWDYLVEKNQLPSQLTRQAFQWQTKNNFFVVGNEVSPYSSTTPIAPGFNKYAVSYSGAWASDNVTIDKATGLLTCGASLINLKGRNDLNMNLGIRFDSEDADSTILANETDRISYLYEVVDKHEYYYLSDTNRCEAMDQSYTYHPAESEIASWQAIDSEAKCWAGDYYYYRKVSITAKTNSSLDASNINNFNDKNNQLGIGWAFDIPAIEFVNTVKYIHFPGGAKYKILSDNKLDGYKLNDIAFSTATGTDFTVNSVQAAYKLSAIDGTNQYFSSTGKYLGAKDIIGNKIQVYYDGVGRIDKIYDTANRYLDINYTIDSGVSRTVTISLVDNDTQNPTTKLLYTIFEDYVETLNSLNVYNYLLTTITDAVNRVKTFDYEAYNSYVHFNSRSSYGTPTVTNKMNTTIGIIGIEELTGAYNSYSYTVKHMAYGPASSRDYKRVSAVVKKSSKTANDSYNSQTYGYAYDDAYWRYESNKMWPLSLTNTIARNYKVMGELKAATDISNGLMKEMELYLQNSNSHQVNSTNYSWNSFGLPTDIYEHKNQYEYADPYAYSTTDYLLKQTTIEWDTLGYKQQLSIEAVSGDNESGVSYMCDTKTEASYSNNVSKTIPTYIYEYNLEDGNDIYATRTYNAIGSTTNKIESSAKCIYNTVTHAVVGNNITDAYYDYDYDIQDQDPTNNYGQIIQASNRDLQTNITKVVDYVYDSKYVTYPASTTLNDVLDSDNNSQDITTQATYDMFGNVMTSTDANGYVTENEYDDLCNLTLVTYPNDTTDETTYNFTNRYTTVVKADGTATKTQYDVFGNETNDYRLNSDGMTWDETSSKTYDDLMRIESETEYQNIAKTIYEISAYSYDLLNRNTGTLVENQDSETMSESSVVYKQGVFVTEEVEPEQYVTKMYNTVTTTTETAQTVDGDSTRNIQTEYQDINGRNIRTDTSIEVGVNHTYTDTNKYDDYGKFIATGGDTGKEEAYQYNQTGTLKNTDYGNNDSDYGQYANSDQKTEFTYDSFGQVTNQKDANNTYVDYVNNHDSNPNNNTDTKSIITYDLLGRTIKTQTPFSRDTNGTLIYSTTKTYYDPGGRVIEVKKTNNDCENTTATYEDTKYTYNNMNKVIKIEKVIDSTHSQFTQYYYDTKGNVLRIYSGLHDPITINEQGQVTNGNDSNYSTIKYAYDAYGRLTSYKDALDNEETYEYYPLSNQLYIKHMINGNTFTYSYDEDGNITQIVGTKGQNTITQTFTFDKAGNKLTSQEGNQTITYTYDNMNRCLTESYTLDGKDYLKEYTYDGENMTHFYVYLDDLLTYLEYYYYSSDGKLAKVSYDGYDETFCRYQYDNNGNIINVGVGKQINSTQNKINDKFYSYNLANLATSAKTPSSPYSTRLIDNYSYTGSTFTGEIYKYNLDNNLNKKIGVTIDGSENVINVKYTNFIYDNVNRLTCEQYGTYSGGMPVASWHNNYSFDDCNNILNLSYHDDVTNTNSKNTVNTYNAANRIQTQVIKNYNNTVTLHDYSFTYDSANNASNLIYKNDGLNRVITYTYDEMNRMTSSTPYGGTATTYTYDSENRRLSKTTGSNKMTSVWDYDKILLDFNENGSTCLMNSYIQGNQGEINDGNLYANFVNGQNDTIGVYNYANSATSNYSYDSYGNKINTTTNLTPKNYRDQYYDSETGLYYLNARYYDPTTQHFLQDDNYRDDNLEMNLTGYCSGNAVSRSDPSGHSIKWVSNGISDGDNLFINALKKLTGAKTINSSKQTITKKVKYTKYKKSCYLVNRLITAQSKDNRGYKRDQITRIDLKLANKITDGYIDKDDDNTNRCYWGSLGNAAQIYWDPINSIEVYTGPFNSFKNRGMKPMHPWLILAHELIHAYHIINGTFLDTDRYKNASAAQKEYVDYYKCKPETLFCEELATVGVQGFGSNSKITENSIRQEHGFQKRLNYYEGWGVE